MTRFIADYSATPMARHIPIPVRPQAMTPGRVLTMAELARIESAAMRLKRPLTPEEMVAEARPLTMEQIKAKRREVKLAGQRARRAEEGAQSRRTRAEGQDEVMRYVTAAKGWVSMSELFAVLGSSHSFARRVVADLVKAGKLSRRREKVNEPWAYCLPQMECDL